MESCDLRPSLCLSVRARTVQAAPSALSRHCHCRGLKGPHFGDDARRRMQKQHQYFFKTGAKISPEAGRLFGRRSGDCSAMPATLPSVPEILRASGNSHKHPFSVYDKQHTNGGMLGYSFWPAPAHASIACQHVTPFRWCGPCRGRGTSRLRPVRSAARTDCQFFSDHLDIIGIRRVARRA